MFSEEPKEDIYDFSGVSYDLSALRSELTQLSGKRKIKSSGVGVVESSEFEKGHKSDNNSKQWPFSSTGILPRSNDEDNNRPPKLPPKEKGLILSAHLTKVISSHSCVLKEQLLVNSLF